MTLRTTSATRRRVVSRSSEVASTSATSSSKGSICKCCAGLERTDPIVSMIAAGFRETESTPVRSGFCRLLGVRQCCAAFLSTTLLPRHYADIGQGAVALRVIQPIADHQFIGDLEADVIALKWKLAPRGLIQQRSDFECPRL